MFSSSSIYESFSNRERILSQFVTIQITFIYIYQLNNNNNNNNKIKN